MGRYLALAMGIYNMNLGEPSTLIEILLQNVLLPDSMFAPCKYLSLGRSPSSELNSYNMRAGIT
jgi:hypothetical protein